MTCNEGGDRMTFEEELDNFTMSSLNFEKEEAKAFRMAMMNLVYEDLFHPLWNRHVNLQKATSGAFIVIILLQLIVILLQLRPWVVVE